MKKLSFQIVLGMLVLACTNAGADLMRDYYSEPGIQDYKGLESQYINESVDAFGGTVQLHFKDAIIPGNGGLDIVIQRSYKSHQRNLMFPQFMGLGWTMHYGRITVPAAHKNKVCLQRLSYSISTEDNPSLEFPDGAAELLVLDDYSSSPNRYLITKNNWLVTCRLEGGFDVKSPDGTTYIMDRQFIGETQAVGWYTSKVTDKHGNTLTMTYGEDETPYGVKSFLQQIDASDGRRVVYNYAGGLLGSVQYNGQTVASYSYAPTSGSADWLLTAYDLVGVSLPAGQDWTYEYYPRALESNGEPEAQSNQLKSITYPTGAKATYDYQKIAFDTSTPDAKTHAIRTKTLSSPSSPSATWDYQFVPGAASQTKDQTIITGPESIIKYEHCGLAYARNGIEAAWLIGLPTKREVYELGGVNLREKMLYSYNKRTISDENFWHGRDRPAVDEHSYAALMTSQYTERDGVGTSTTYENFDAYGNPQRVTKSNTSGAVAGDLVTETVYRHDVPNWIIGLPEQITETVGTVHRTTQNTYNSRGDIERQDVNGVVTTMIYHASGDLESKTEPGNQTTQFGNYSHGVARYIANPDGTSVSRSVDDFGRITSITDERNKTRGFSYDGVGRLTGINYPEGASVSITYGERDKTLHRGAYTEVTDTDGWGRVTSVNRNGIAVTTRYSPEGRRIFTSYPGSAQGTSYEYDAIGRQTRVVHPDGDIQITHNGAFQHIRDERGNTRELLYQSFGGFDGAQLVQVMEQNVTGDDPGTYLINVLLDGFGHPTRVQQGVLGDTGKVRTYDYDGRFYLVKETNPETGDTIYTRDAAGNMMSKAIGSLAAIGFEYDARDRLKTINYPTSPDITGQVMASERVDYEYDPAGNVTNTSKGNVRREFAYSDNGNLTLDRTVVDGVTYDVTYGYTELDHLNSITYPSGRSLAYDTDALGRATKLGNYISQIDYHPSGQVSNMTYANGVNLQLALNDRRLVSGLHLYGAQGDVLNLGYGYDAGQNITSITDNLDPTKSRAYVYDEINRLVQADTSAGVTQYGYNRNDGLVRIQSGTTTSSILYANGVIAEKGARQFDRDALGNIRRHAIYQITGSSVDVIDSHVFAFDHSGALRHANKPQQGIDFNWTYDAEGMRVLSQSAGGARTVHIHNKAGQLLGEYKNGVFTGKETIYLGDQPVVTVKGNEPPINVNAGADLQAGSGEVVTLAPSAVDPESRPITYAWQQVTGTAAQINVANGSTRITMPMVASQENLVFRVTATDEKGGSTTDDLAVTLLPPPADLPPVANPGSAQTVMEAYAFTLDGSASSDAEGAITFRWSNVSGPYVGFSNPTIAIQQVTAPAVSANSISTVALTVTDSQGQTDTEPVQITVKDDGPDTDGDGLPDGWEMFFFGNLAAIATADVDADGITNLQEYAEKTRPNVAEAAPLQVTGVTAFAGDASAVVEWKGVISASKYTVYWSQTSGFDMASASKVDTQAKSVTLTGLTNARQYYFKVVASNLTGTSVPSSEASAYINSRAWSTKAAEIQSPINTRGRWVEVIRVNDSLYNVYLYSQGSNQLKSLQVSSYSSGVAMTDIKAAVDDLDNIALVWWEAGYLVSATASTSAQVATKERIGCYKNCWQSDGQHNVSDGTRLVADQRGNFLLVWVDSIVPSSANSFYKTMVYRLKPGAPSVRFTIVDADISSPSTALYGFYDELSVRKAASGVMLVAWPREKTTGKYLRVAEFDLQTLSTTQLLDEVVELNLTSKGNLVGLSANPDRVSVYWESGTTIYGRDRPVTSGVWGAAYVLPRGGLLTPQSIIEANASAISENVVYSNTKNSTTTYYANSRTPTGTWGASAINLGFAAHVTHALANGEHIVVGNNANGLAARVRNAAGTWGTLTSIKAGIGVNEIESVRSDLLGNISIIWSGSTNGLQVSEFRPIVYVPDTVAPVTSIATTRRTSKGKTYMDCTLTANEPATTYFRVTGAGTITAGGAATTAWQTYTSKVTVQLTGTATIEYYSVDPGSNTEVTKSGILQ